MTERSEPGAGSGDGSREGTARGRWRAAALLVAVALLVLLVRTLGFEQVFHAGDVLFPPADPQYHLRRAYYSFVNFPGVLPFDVYINHPGGSAVSWPPGFDLALAAAARLFARDVHGFERVAAWAPALLGAATAVPIAFAGSALGSRGLGLAAGGVFAFLPVSFHYTALGNTDHHAAVAAIGAWLLCLCMQLVDPAASVRRTAWLGTGLALAQLALLLTWHGSLLVLGPVAGLLLLAAASTGSRRLAVTQALAAAASAVALVPVLFALPEPLGGPFSAIALSWLHVLALAAAAAAGAWLAMVPAAVSARGPASRLGWLAVGALVPLGGALVLQGSHAGLREGLAPAFGFLTLSDGAGLATNEQRALFDVFGRAAEPQPALAWGAFAWVLPFAPLAAWLHARSFPRGSAPRAAALLLTAWSAFFVALAVSQMRYGNDCAPAASLCIVVALALGVRFGFERAAGRSAPRGLVPFTGFLVWGLAISPAFAGVFLPRAKSSLAALRGETWPHERAAVSVEATAARFLSNVRRLTPETSSYLAPWRDAVPPEYGVIAHPNLGHAIQYLARRPTATDPFWAYIGEANWALTRAFLGARSEPQALAAARLLDGRYVVTMPTREQGTVPWRLHFHDGAAGGAWPALQHFRLIAESAEAGQSLLARRRPDPPGTPPYKLFEIVTGAVLEVRAAPGGEVGAFLALATPTGRAFDYQARGRASEDGIARLRLPYATDGRTPVRARGLWRVRVGGETRRIAVAEADVVEGATLRLEEAPR